MRRTMGGKRWLGALLLCGALLIGHGPCGAQPVRVLSPEACVELALAQNRHLDAARHQAAEAAGAYRAARTHRWPALSGQGRYQRLSDNIPDFEVDFAPLTGSGSSVFAVPAILNRYEFRLQLEQPVFTGLRLHHTIRAASYRSEAAWAAVGAAEAEVAFAVRAAYWALVEAQAVVEAVAAAEAEVAAHLHDVEALYEQGMALRSDVLAVQARAAEVRLQQIDAEHALSLARLALNDQMGLPLATRVEPDATVHPVPLAEAPEVLVDRAWRRRAELGARALETAALEAGVRAQQAAWWPQVALVGTYDYARPNPYVFPQEETFTGTWEVGVLVTMDLWDWGQTRAQVGQATERAGRARAELEALRTTIEREVRQRVLEVERAVAAVAAAERGVEQAEEAYRVMRVRVQHGTALTADVLAAEAALRSARLRHAEALADYAVARAALDRATGAPVRR